MSGIEVFRQTNPGQSKQQATIPITQTNLPYFFLPFDNAANTSIALANPDPAVTATINVTFRYVDGTSNTAQLTLLPRNCNANVRASLFTATAGKAGVAEFMSNVPIAVVRSAVQSDAGLHIAARSEPIAGTSSNNQRPDP